MIIGGILIFPAGMIGGCPIIATGMTGKEILILAGCGVLGIAIMILTSAYTEEK